MIEVDPAWEIVRNAPTKGMTPEQRQEVIAFRDLWAGRAEQLEDEISRDGEPDELTSLLATYARDIVDYMNRALERC